MARASQGLSAIKRRRPPRPGPTRGCLAWGPPRTRQDVKPERAFHQRRPTPTVGLTLRRLGGISVTSLLGGRVLHARIAVIPGRPAPNDVSPPGPSTPPFDSRSGRPEHRRGASCSPKLMRGRGTSTASRPRNSTGSNTTSVVPSRHGCRSCHRTRFSSVRRIRFYLDMNARDEVRVVWMSAHPGDHVLAVGRRFPRSSAIRGLPQPASSRAGVVFNWSSGAPRGGQ